MLLFHQPPNHFYGVLGYPRRNTETAEAIDLQGPLGQKIVPLSVRVGSGETTAEIMYVPLGKTIDILENHPNTHVYQILGHSWIDSRTINPGDMARVESGKVLAQGTPHAPCVYARIMVESPHDFSASEYVASHGERTPEQQAWVDQILVTDWGSRETCESVIDSLDQSSGSYAHVLADDVGNRTELRRNVRLVSSMHSNKPKLTRDVLRDVVVNVVEPFYKTTIEFWNTPVLLKYEPGNFFLPHVDGETFRDGAWHRIYDRDYTLVVFLNDTYEGGDLSFPDLNFVVRPKQGRVVVFPGHHVFRHGAETTKTGVRYQLVSWLTQYGTSRTNSPPNPSKIWRTGLVSSGRAHVAS